MPGENCSSSCPTRDHNSWGECVRGKALKTQWLGGTGPSLADQRKFERDTAAYRQVVRDGGSLSTAMHKGTDAAYREIGR